MTQPTEAPQELTLNDRLADPIVRALMHRDGVTEQQIRTVISGASPSIGTA